MSIEDTFEQLFDYYRSDSSVRAMFKDQNLNISVKFGDTKRKFTVKIQQDKSIILEPDSSLDKPDIKIRIKSEHLLTELVNGELPVPAQFAKGRIMITKGFVKIAKIYRKYVKED